MAVESADDRAVFVSPADFGVTATYTLAAGGASSVNGIFNGPHLSLQVGNVEISDVQPVFVCATADLPVGAAGGDAGDILTIAAVARRVIDLQPDGSGITTITLGKS